MNTTTLKVPALAVIISILQSCIMNTVVQDIDQTIEERDKYISKSTCYQEGKLAVAIKNNAENTLLQIDSVEICNILLYNQDFEYQYTGDITIMKYNNTGNLSYGTDSLWCTTTLPEQVSVPWSPEDSPYLNKGSYAKIHGAVYTYIADNSLLLLHSGTMYCPVGVNITRFSATLININIYGNCQLYACINGKMRKVLQPITFGASVEDWTS